MEIKYTNYEINLKDIKEYEESMIKLGKTSDRLGLKILNKIEAVICNKSKPVFGLKDYDHNDKYYRDYKNRHEGVLNDIVERFKLNFFFVNGDCFDFDENIIIDNTFLEFDFWFVLKLRQYEFRLSEVRNLLKFQFEENFNKNKKEFIDFLNFCIREHETKFLDCGVVSTVYDLIENKFHNKLILKIKYEQSNLFNALKEYFNKEHHDKLFQLLNEEEILDKICFRSNASQLVMVFRQLHLNQKIIGSLVNTEKWICNYFTYYGQSKKQSTFNAENVHKLLTKQFYDIPKAKRIELPGLKYIRDKKK